MEGGRGREKDGFWEGGGGGGGEKEGLWEVGEGQGREDFWEVWER